MNLTIKHQLLKLASYFLNCSKESHVFIIGHARSGSSLLMHILCSNKEILGFGEEFITFKKDDDLNYSTSIIRLKNLKFFEQFKYIAHQITANGRTPNTELLAKENVKIIILVRNPEDTLKSLMALSKKNNNEVSINKLTEYYIERLNFQNCLMKEIKEQSRLLITYENLISDPKIILNKISIFLNLKKALTKNYELKKFTQITGDPSENILHGEIKRTSKHNIELDEKLLNLAKARYQSMISYYIKDYE